MQVENSVRMTVAGVTVDPVTKAPIVVLKDESGEINLPIWVGLLEANAMVSEMRGVKPPRPMTHDLLRTLVAELGGEVEAVEICDLKDGTYYATLHLLASGERSKVDCRPSDAISIALRTESPIFVQRHVIESSNVAAEDEEGADGEDAQSEAADLSTVSRDQWADILESMDPDDFKYKT